MHKTNNYKNILTNLQQDIASGFFSAGEKLPSERDYAKTLNVHRSTVAHAYNILVEQGILERKIGSGTYVSNSNWGIQVPEKFSWRKKTKPTEYEKKYWQTVHQSMAKSPDKPWRRLDDGNAPKHWLPKGKATYLSWDDLLNESAATDELGLYTLREAVSCHLKKVHGMHIDPREILITSGTQQALYLVTHGFLQPGDTIAIESPSYFYSLQLFRSAGLKLIPIPYDTQGPSLNHLKHSIENNTIRMLFLNPIFQNPTGIQTSTQRKKEIIQFCATNHIPIFEDDASSLIPYQSDSDIHPIKASDHFQQILYAGSISKYMGPSIRIGWLIGPAQLISNLAELRKDMDAGLSALPQIIVRDYLTNNIDQQITSMQLQIRDKLNDFQKYMKACHPELSPLATKGGFYQYYQFLNINEKNYQKKVMDFLDDYMVVQLGHFFGDTKHAFRINITQY